MSIQELFKLHGINVPRFVTVDGTVVFDDVSTSAGGGYRHATLGSVTPVARHTFHGGVEPVDNSDIDARWWSHESLVQRHRNAMAGSFPNFTALPYDEDTPPGWIGVIDTGRGRFRILIQMRWDEDVLPAVVPVGPRRLGKQHARRWVRSPHLYNNGNLCVAALEDWDPASHTAADVTAWAAHWLAVFTAWRITGRWLVEGFAGDVAV